jgi:hypothetical protein
MFPLRVREAILAIEFTVSNPVGTNATYGRRKRVDGAAGPFGGKSGLFRRSPARAFREAIIRGALAARTTSSWPNDPHRVAKARVAYQLFNWNGDTDSKAFSSTTIATSRTVRRPRSSAMRAASASSCMSNCSLSAAPKKHERVRPRSRHAALPGCSNGRAFDKNGEPKRVRPSDNSTIPPHRDTRIVHRAPRRTPFA